MPKLSMKLQDIKGKMPKIHKRFVLGDLGGDLGALTVEDKKKEEDQELKISINFIVSSFSLYVFLYLDVSFFL